MWVQKHEPELYARTHKMLHAKDWLNFKLTGVLASEYSDASGTNLLDLKSLTWSPKLIQAAGLDADKLPRLLSSTDVVGELTREAAEALGLKAGIPVVAAGGDGQVFAAAVQGNDGESSSTLTLGTSVVLGIPARESSISTLYRTLFAASPDRSYLLEAVIQSGTYLFRWLEDLFSAGDGRGLAAWEQEAQAFPPGSEGLVTVPHWWGTRFPAAQPDARGATLGWSHHHGQAHVYRSLLEGVAFELKHYLEAAAPRLPGGWTPRVIAGGGGAKSRLWRSIIAEVLGCELAIPGEQEPVALGAAMLAAVGAVCAGDLAEAASHFVRPGETVAPDAGRQARYSRLYHEVYVPLREEGARLSATLTRLTRE